ncbi:MAG TPA: GAF and ANTAR domain-containing protein [Mycobacteriales bacterium]|nr:GAF and ANTAR domain-containing protein [Mycobacteriales bacterium]
MSEQLGGAQAASGAGGHGDAVMDTLLRLSDSSVDDYDVVGQLRLLADGGVRLVGGAAAVVFLGDQNGNLAVAASTSEPARLLAIAELQHEQGPGVASLDSGPPVVAGDLAASRAIWPQYVPAARAAGFRAGLAVPLRRRDEQIGALEVLYETPQQIDLTRQQLAAALAAAAAIGILSRRRAQQDHMLAEQLQHALNSRVLIEQAKGIIAERHRLGMDGAFESLRHHARSHNSKLNDIAARVVAGQLDVPPAVPRQARPPAPS